MLGGFTRTCAHIRGGNQHLSCTALKSSTAPVHTAKRSLSEGTRYCCCTYVHIRKCRQHEPSPFGLVPVVCFKSRDWRIVGGRAKTQELRDRLSKGEGFDDIIEEAFAVVREAAWRVLELRHYDVQVQSNISILSHVLQVFSRFVLRSATAALVLVVCKVGGDGHHTIEWQSTQK